MNDDKRFAVLIDADNVSDNILSILMRCLIRDNHIQRIYGDWTKPTLGPWKMFP